MRQITTSPGAIPILIILASLFVTTTQIDCNATHFEFFSNFSLGKQEELNQTFDQILPFIKVPPISYKATDFSTFNITNTTVKFRYLDSQQKAVIIGKDTIGIYGGVLEVSVSFAWLKNTMVGNINGTAQAKILSSEIMFEKTLQIDQGYLDYKLAYFYNVSFQFTNYTLTRIDPSTTSATDIANILNALNVDKETQCLKTVVQREISQFYGSYLARNLKNQHYPLDDHFDYTYTNPWSKKTITIPFMLVPTGVDLEPDGLSLTFVSYIKDDPNWKCGRAVPTQELNPRVYGGLQEFIEFSVFSNTVRYAFEKGMLDTDLTRSAWQSKLFEFFAGDLYEVIPQLPNKFMATDQVTGKCQYNAQQQVIISRHNSSVVNTTTLHLCSLSIVGTKIAEFEVRLNLQVDILANETNLNLKVIHAEGQPIFRGVSGFEVKNKQLAEHMILHSLNRMKEGYTFGSGWKIYPRDYSHVLLGEHYIVIYDSTHVEQASLSQE